jgi:hypothetical protein
MRLFLREKNAICRAAEGAGQTVSTWCRERLVRNKLPEDEKAVVNFDDERELTGPRSAWAPEPVGDGNGAPEHTRD